MTEAPTRPDLRPVRVQSVTSGLDITAFICAWFVPFLGMILGMVGIHDAHRQGRNASGLAIAATVIGIAMTVLAVVLVIGIVAAAHSAPDPTQQYLNCLNNSIANNTDVALCVPPN